MYFSPFNANTTNIFPATNTKQGGQLLTEFNLRSVDSVSTDPEVTYMLGPSFVHSEHEFDLSHDDVEENAILTIAPGKAVVNGHYFESLVPIKIDIAKGNALEVSNNGLPIYGKLVVGLRMMYSTNTTLVGTLDTEGNYQGVQVVVLPESQFILPGQTEDAKTDQDVVTAHIKLGSFVYRNSTIQHGSIVNNLNKTKYLDVYRIMNIDDSLGSDYFDKRGLKDNTLYTVAAKFEVDGSGVAKVSAGFCDSNESLMKWDSNPTTFGQSEDLALRDMLKANPSARFLSSSDGRRVFLYIPHKQVDNNSTKTIKDTDYKPVQLDIPVANLAAGTPGIVDVNYSAGINAVLNKINEFYHLPNGKYLMYMDVLESKEDMPKIPTGASVGDYIIVRNDETLEESVVDPSYSWPATLYMVLPGKVQSVVYSSTKPSGMEVASTYSSDAPNTSNADTYNKYWDYENMLYRGIKNQDYFTYYYTQVNDKGESYETPYYYKVNTCGVNEWSDAIIVTAQIPLATEELVGGFYNVPDTSEYSDLGYVYRDENGNLLLRDYGLLRSGTLAYQLGSDFTRTGLTLEELQVELDEYVNERVAFPNTDAKESASNIINITIELPEDEEGGEIEIRGIDSRFNTSVYLHIQGNANSNTVVKIIDVEKLRIDSSIQGSPSIEIHRCNLYYDAYVINQLSVIKNMQLWYERFSEEDAHLVVDNMTVRELEASIPVEDVDYWSTSNVNDVHYQYALQSLTFDNDGEVVGVGLYMRDCTTRNVVPEGKHMVVSEFTLPQGSGLLYPPSRFTKKLKVTGSFVSAYVPTQQESMQIYAAHVSFTAVTKTYDPLVSEDEISGNISIYDDSCVIDSVGGDGAIVTGDSVDIPGMNTNEFHIFQGGVIG